MIVVHASAAVLALLNDGEARARLAADTLATPHLADSEVAHALRAQVRRGDIAASVAGRALTAWANLGIERLGVVGLLDRIWALRNNLTAYDATYVALAEALDASLLTADARLARAPGLRCEVDLIDS